jgi:NADP-dependent 3-hydroxy acid dehydrogenase YdfG
MVRLDGAVVVTAADTPSGEANARALAPVARAVVLCGTDAARLGALAAELRDVSRIAVLCGEAGEHADALRELVAELFATDVTP